ncbi:hypothetical protein [Cellulomonas marina]|uniref:Uncharacterized protein n=1 Tax=Cellulomonas marina TaxID=988821 RepID=A0A1I0YMD8_9CELL|nr:hypothetical protein [Cellulomonas marina]GIG27633.1 hypothetical protein Cma02nite_02330 [Cellulomonas marina]SFB14494.1 hypothetical protein SAMN05421867_10841 [Cellulomonas marina]
MSDAPQGGAAGATEEGGYGYPTLEQEVAPEVLEDGAGTGGSGTADDGGDGATDDEQADDAAADAPAE